MTELRIETEWADVTGRERPEVLATYANLRIAVGAEVVTKVHHRSSRTTRDSVLVSLCPLAEWIAENWWTLNRESEVVGREAFLARHSIFHGRNGCCLPDLRLISEGECVRAEWMPYRYTHAPIDFLSGGVALLATEAVEGTLRELIERVIDRLDAAGIRDTRLQSEWSAVQETEGDAEQRAFCLRAGWLGLDPFDVSEEDAQTIADADHRLPAHLREDAFRATQLRELPVLLRWIEQAIDQKPVHASNGDLERLRTTVRAGAPQRDPWKVGYDLARQMRECAPQLTGIPVLIESLFGGRLPLITVPDAPRGVDGLASLDHALSCCTTKRRPDSQRFLSARALYDFLSVDEPQSLLSGAVTARQAAGRAFAAELLAPAAELRERMEGDAIGRDHIDEIAAEWNVSSYVVEHQIRNHQLAAILG